MPELPDVEIARRKLQRWLVGARVTDAECTDAYLARPVPPSHFARLLTGRTVLCVERKGKWLRLSTDDGGRVFSHLGMTGGWVRVDLDAPPCRFEHARIDVLRRERAASVRYVDARRFGRLVTSRIDIDDWHALGPDPLAEGIDIARLSDVFARSRRAVKDLLMDQSVLAGVGNILATEALWMARTDPRSRGGALDLRAVRAIARAVRRAIDQELGERGGASFSAYGRAGEPCHRCRTTLSKITQSGRTTAFCRTCQIRYSRVTSRTRTAARLPRPSRRPSHRLPRRESRRRRAIHPFHPFGL